MIDAVKKIVPTILKYIINCINHLLWGKSFFSYIIYFFFSNAVMQTKDQKQTTLIVHQTRHLHHQPLPLWNCSGKRRGYQRDERQWHTIYQPCIHWQCSHLVAGNCCIHILVWGWHAYKSSQLCSHMKQISSLYLQEGKLYTL